VAGYGGIVVGDAHWCRGLAAAVLAAGCLGPAQAVADTEPARGYAGYTVDAAQLEQSVRCVSGQRRGGLEVVDGSGAAEPVLLVHGAGFDREETWSWNYGTALPAEGFEVCLVDLPQFGYLDKQLNAEHIAWAVERMADEADEPVDVLGVSQGGVSPRWVVRYFQAGRQVDDLVALAAPQHGTVVFDAETAPGQDFPSAWQLRTRAQYVATLNAGDETPGRVDYTSIYTATDELVQPVGTQALEGGTNLLLQEVCPGRSVDHLGMVVDGVVHRLTVDALAGRGGADVRRAGVTCAETLVPGLQPPPVPGNHESPLVCAEPALRPYALRGRPQPAPGPLLPVTTCPDQRQR
jgi:triacylglycerol lipase